MRSAGRGLAWRTPPDASACVTRFVRTTTPLRAGCGRWPEIPAHNLVITNTSLVGVFAGGYSRAELDAIHANLAALVADGRLRNAVTAKVPFAELPDALQRMADRGVVGKLVMVP